MLGAGASRAKTTHGLAASSFSSKHASFQCNRKQTHQNVGGNQKTTIPTLLHIDQPKPSRKPISTQPYVVISKGFVFLFLVSSKVLLGFFGIALVFFVFGVPSKASRGWFQCDTGAGIERSLWVRRIVAWSAMGVASHICWYGFVRLDI